MSHIVSENSFLPEVTCTVPGDLSVAYVERTGLFTVDDAGWVDYWMRVKFTPTFTTSAGGVLVKGLPDPDCSISAAIGGWMGAVMYASGFTWPYPSGFLTTNIEPYAPFGVRVFCAGSNSPLLVVQIGNLASGQQVQFRVSGRFKAA